MSSSTPSRHHSRQRAVQILYLCDIRKQDVEEAIDAFYNSLATSEVEDDAAAEDAPPPDPFMEDLARGAMSQAAQTDERLARNSANWRVERMPMVDRNILRLAVYELSIGQTPPPVVIDEALELARRFSGDASVAFVNGVLDSIRKELGK